MCDKLKVKMNHEDFSSLQKCIPVASSVSSRTCYNQKWSSNFNFK